MSKKAFKRAIGNLLKQGKIEKTEDGYFKLVNKKQIVENIQGGDFYGKFNYLYYLSSWYVEDV